MKLHLPKMLFTALLAAFSLAYADTVTTTYVSGTNGVGTANGAFTRQEGSTDGPASFTGTINLANLSTTTDLVLSGNNQGTISNVGTNGGWGGRVAFNNSAATLTTVTIDKGIEANVTNIQSQSGLTVNADNASFFGNGNDYTFNIVVGENGVRMNGSSNSDYKMTGSISGSGTFFSCTGGDTRNLTLTGDVSAFTGSFIGGGNYNAGMQRAINFGDGSASTATQGVIGGGVGSATAVTRAVNFNYTGDLEVKGGLYATTVTATNLTNLTLDTDSVIGTLNMGTTNLIVGSDAALTIGTMTTGEGVTITNDGTVNFGSTLTSGGNLTLSGDFTFDMSNVAANYEVKEAGVTTWSDAEQSQGFKTITGAVYYAIKGGVNEGGFTLNEGITAAGDNSGYVFTLDTEDTSYAMTADTATITAADTAKATAYNIESEAATVTVTGGDFNFSLVTAATRSHLDTLVLDGGDATISGNAQEFGSNVVINDGSTLKVTGVDGFDYSETGITETPYTVTVNEGGTLDIGSGRISIGNDKVADVPVFQFVVNGGTITGEGEIKNGSKNGALDFFKDGTVVATGDTGDIAATVRVRGAVTMTMDVQEETDKIKLSGLVTGAGALVKKGEGTLEVSHANDYTGATTINGGTLVMKDAEALGTTGAVNVNEGATLEVASGVDFQAGSRVTFGEGSSLNLAGTMAMDNAAAISSVTLQSGAELTLGNHAETLTTSALTVTGPATINANLVMGNGSALTLAESVTMGCSVTLGQDMTLTLTSPAGYDPATDLILLFDSADAVTLGSHTNTYYEWLEASEVFSSITIDNVAVNMDDYVVGAWDGKVYLATTEAAPEPATATLSLLALAGLMARRRRH